MNRRIFTNLPSEIITDILSRLPIKTIVSCKCVCKSWFELLNTPEFANFHLSKSDPDLIIYHGSTKFRIFEFVDELELESHELHYNFVLEFDKEAFISPPDAAICMEGSANGLLFLRGICMKPSPLYVCNPITREYFKLPDLDPYRSPTVAVYGFGVSMMSGQYKVVRILHDFVREPATGSILSISKSVCRVYTLGTGSWRSIAHCNSYNYNLCSTGVFVSGNLHWLVADLSGSLVVSYFDLEAELFNFFSLPPLPGQRTFEGDLGVSENCLCIRDNTSGNEMAIWEMKEYGIEKSWTKQIIISKLPGLCRYLATCPLKLFKDGDVLFSFGHFFMLYYSNKTKTTTKIDLFKGLPRDRFQARLHVSSFLSLKSFQLETFLTAELLGHLYTLFRMISCLILCLLIVW